MIKIEENGIVDYSMMHGGFETFFLKEQAEKTIADVSLTASFEKQTVTVNSQTRFAINIANASYQLAFVVVEDNMQSSEFYQTNYLTGLTEYNLDGFENQPYKITPFTFNDVALSIAGHRKGIPNSVPKQIKAGETYNFEYSFNVSNIQNPNNARIVAMLIDQNTGYVVNAAQTPLTTTGISSEFNDDVFKVLATEDYHSIKYHQTSENGTLTLTNMDGRIVYQASTKKGTNIIHLPQLTAGVYVASLQTGNSTKTLKILTK